jgi:hypothetical protein
MLMAEIYSLFFLAYIVGLGFLSNYFLHRLDTKALLKSQEVSDLNHIILLYLSKIQYD